MTTTAPQKSQTTHPARTQGGPDPVADLGAPRADSDRQRWTRNESEPPYEGGLAVGLWVLASLIAGFELWSWIFARMYG